MLRSAMLLLFLGLMDAGADELLYVANQSDNSVKAYSATTGNFLGNVVAANAYVNQANGIAIGPDGSIYVSGQASNNIAHFSSAGAYEGDFVAAGSGGLNSPQAIHFGPDGNLYAVSSANDKILKFNGTSGAFMGAFATLGNPSHDGPIDFSFGLDGRVYVTTFDSGRILRFDAATGNFIDAIFTDPAMAVVGSAFGPDGKFYAAVLDKNTFNGEVEQYPASGALLGTFVTNGSGGLATPSDVLFDDAGYLDVLDVGNPSVLQYSSSGTFVKTLVGPGSGGLDSGFFFASVETPEPQSCALLATGLLALLLCTNFRGRAVRGSRGNWEMKDQGRIQ